MLRWLLGRAAGNRALEQAIRRRAAAQRLVARFVAGDTADDGLRVARELVDGGASVTLDHVGEHVGSLDEATAAATVYRDVLGRIADDRHPISISVKPTQLGLLVDPDHAEKLVTELADAAEAAGVHVTLDMEDHRVTEATVALTERLHGSGRTNVACALQAALHRTSEDVRRLTAAGASVRLCKGAYAEPSHVAYQHRREVDRHYLANARYLLAEADQPRFATHDHRLVAAITRAAAVGGRPRETYEFQMLYGVRPPMQQALIRDGYRLRVYLPFGTEWFPYFTRRLAERPANLALFLRAATARRGPS